MGSKWPNQIKTNKNIVSSLRNTTFLEREQDELALIDFIEVIKGEREKVVQSIEKGKQICLNSFN